MTENISTPITEGAIIVKDSENINIVAIGKYEVLESRLPFYCKLEGDKQIKLLNVTGMGINEIIQNQMKINSTFEKEFN